MVSSFFIFVEHLNETIGLKKYGKAGLSMPKKSRNLPQKRKYRFPVALHLKQAVQSLQLHTGVGTISRANWP